MRIRRRPAARAAAGLVLLAVALVAAAAAAAPQEGAAGRQGRTWGLGWKGVAWPSGPTLRWAPGGSWQIGLSGGPQDLLARTGSGGEQGRQEWEDPVAWSGDLEERKDESGWVGLDLARRLWSRERLCCHLVLGGVYDWSNDQVRVIRFDRHAAEPGTDIRREDGHWHAWHARLGLRPAVGLLPRLSVETEFGWEYRWTHRVHDRWEIQQNAADWSHERRHQDNEYFRIWGGWNGFGSVNLIFWF